MKLPNGSSAPAVPVSVFSLRDKFECGNRKKQDLSEKHNREGPRVLSVLHGFLRYPGRIPSILEYPRMGPAWSQSNIVTLAEYPRLKIEGISRFTPRNQHKGHKKGSVRYSPKLEYPRMGPAWSKSGF